jgi:signal transduction histidine kinase
VTCDHFGVRQRLALASVLVCGLALGAFSLSVARSDPGYSFGGASAFAGAAELLAGYSLLAVGVVASARPGGRGIGAILVSAAIAGFLIEWNNPGAGSAFVFTVGLVLYVSAPPLVAHAVLAYPNGRVRSWLDGLGLAVAYAGAVLVLGVFAATVFDPGAQGCAQCPRNLVLVSANGGAYESLNRIGVWLGLFWSLLLIVLVIAGLVRSTPARRRVVTPVILAGCAYLGLVATAFAHSLERGYLSNDPLDRRLWLAEAVALCALALGATWSPVRARRTRGALASLVVELADSPRAGGLRDALSRTLDDASLQLAYALDDDRLVDAAGQPVALEGEVTPIAHRRRELALLAHRPGLLDDPALVEEVAAAARLALENERLQAETRAQLEELRASRARIVEAGDAERRRLERDLHDGAQQRLVSLSLALRLARSRLEFVRDPGLLACVNEAEAEVRTALAELRELAHGLFPVVLTDEGLAAAVEALAEAAPIPLEIIAFPEERLAPSVEAAAYIVVSETVRLTEASALKVCAAHRNGRLVIEVRGDGELGEIVDLDDRVGALDGSIEVVRAPSGQVTILAEIPCAS